MTKICSVSKKYFFQLFYNSNPQIVFVGSKQSVSYKTQSGRTYGPMTSCKVNFKVISRLPSKTAISTIYGIVLFAKLHFVFWSLNVYCRRWLPVPHWWCPVQPLMSFTQEETAKGKRAIHSRSERKGLKSYTAVGVVLCWCGSMWTHLTILRFPGSVGRTALTGCRSKEKTRLLFSNPTRKATEVALTAP